MERASHLIVTYLLNSLWQVTLVFALASLCAVLLRRVSANVRHMLWVMALALSVLLPVASLPRFAAEPRSNAAAADSPDTTLRVTAVANKTTAKRGRFHLPHLSPVQAAPALLWTVAGCYFAFLLYRVIRIYRAGQHTRALSRTASEQLATGPLTHIVQRYSSAMGLRGIPSVYLTDGIGPVTIGIRRPLLLVPAAFAETASEQEKTSAVCHELAHIRRHDFLLNLICELLWLPISFHPVAALIKSRIGGTRELACDETATRLLSAPSVYARSLVSIARAMSSSTPVRQPSYGQGLFDSKGLEERIMNLVGNRRLIHGGWAHALSAITITLLATASVSAATFSVQIAKPGIIPLPAAAAAQAESAGKTSSQPVSPQAQSATASDVSGRTAIRSFTLVGGSELPNAQELLAQELKSGMYPSDNYRNEIPERVRVFFQRNGYFKATVTKSSFKQAGPTAVDATVRVSAGPQYRLRDISFRGGKSLSESQLRALFPLQPGEVFDSAAISTGLQAIVRLYRERGYPKVVLFPEISKDDLSSTILVTINLQEGSPGTTRASASPGSEHQDVDLPGYYKVGNGVTAPHVVYAPDPKYDPEAKAAKSQGVAVYRVGVGSNGLVKELRFVRSHDDVNGGELMPGLIQNGLDSLRTWRFEPALKDGKAVPVQVNVEVNFRLF
jgi:beta-lactamase regulating signal transducer with metallopeptidase domain